MGRTGALLSLAAAALLACAAPAPRKAPPAPPAAEPSLEVRSPEDAVRLHRLGVSETNLLEAVRASRADLRVSEADAARLAAAGLPPAVLAALRTHAGAPVGEEDPPTLLILDASRSMGDAIEGVPKLAMAKVVLLDLLERRASAPVGLVAFGHRDADNCEDVQPLVRVAPGASGRVRDALNGLYARGRSPLAHALAQARILLPEDGSGRVLVITDGVEGCGGDPCAVAGRLRRSGRVAAVDVVGLDPGLLARQGGACIAREGGGTFTLARNLDELAASVWRVRRARAIAEEAAARGGEPAADPADLVRRPLGPTPSSRNERVYEPPVPYDLGALRERVRALAGPSP